MLEGFRRLRRRWFRPSARRPSATSASPEKRFVESDRRRPPSLGPSSVSLELPPPQWVSFRDGSNTRSTFRFNARMTPIRASIVDHPRSAAYVSTSAAGPHWNHRGGGTLGNGLGASRRRGPPDPERSQLCPLALGPFLLAIVLADPDSASVRHLGGVGIAVTLSEVVPWHHLH
jgi:hypothetical protein